MIVERMVEFTEALRAAKVPVSLLETIDAAEAVRSMEIGDRTMVRASLAACLIKDQSHRAVFDQLFDVYFSPGDSGVIVSDDQSDLIHLDDPFPQFDDDQLREMLINDLINSDSKRMSGLVSASVDRFAGMEPGRPVGGVYYAFRTIRQLNLDAMKASIYDRRLEMQDEVDSLGKKLLNRDIDQALERVKKLIDSEIRRRLISDRGAGAVARSVRATLPEDVEFMHADKGELEEISRTLVPLVHKLASRLSHNRRLGLRGSLDFRKTIRHSLGYGGVPVELLYHKPMPSKLELMVVADISGSVASFARFTLSMLYALSGQFSKVRSFVFIDEIDEVSEIFENSSDAEDAMKKINDEAKVVWMDGHSDYGRVMESFVERVLDEVTSRTSVIFLGDARNNYHDSRSHVLASVRMKAHAIHWLNPEPAAYWDSGDSIIGEYAPYCDSVNECRNLRQLQSFIERLE